MYKGYYRKKSNRHWLDTVVRYWNTARNKRSKSISKSKFPAGRGLEHWKNIYKLQTTTHTHTLFTKIEKLFVTKKKKIIETEN